MKPVALVTGGATGIGAMIAEGFVRAGKKTYVASRSRDRCAEVCARLSEWGECVPLALDLADMDSVRTCVAELAERETALEVLVNCAGTTWAAPLESYPEDAFDKNWAVNVKGPFYLTVGLLPLLRAGVSEAGRAGVVNIGSSDGTLVSTWDNFAYSASKAAMHHLTRQLATRLEPDGITVNCVAPGPFHSRMTDFVFTHPEILEPLLDTVPLGRAGTAEEAAGTVAFLASGRITGAVLPLDGGWAASRR